MQTFLVLEQYPKDEDKDESDYLHCPITWVRLFPRVLQKSHIYDTLQAFPGNGVAKLHFHTCIRLLFEEYLKKQR